jgi:hypothetical protein
MTPVSRFSGNQLLLCSHCFSTRGQSKPRCVSNTLLVCCSERVKGIPRKCTLSPKAFTWGQSSSRCIIHSYWLWSGTTGFCLALGRVVTDGPTLGSNVIPYGYQCGQGVLYPEPMTCQDYNSTSVGPRPTLLWAAYCWVGLMAQDYCDASWERIIIDQGHLSFHGTRAISRGSAYGQVWGWGPLGSAKC